MKRFVSLGLHIFLGIVLSFVVHAGIELPAIYFLTNDFDTYGLGLSWNAWFWAHHIGGAVLFIAGVWFGYWLWRKEKRT